MSHYWTKDPDAVLDFEFDWSTWLATGETISTHTIIASDVTVDESTASTTAVVAWLSGGVDGTAAAVTCRVVTSEGRTDDRTNEVLITER